MVSVQTRRFRVLLLYAACLLPAVIWGAIAALQQSQNSPFEWVPSTFGPRQQYQEFCRDFGSGEVLIISWPGCTIDSPDLQLLTQSLRRTDIFHGADGEPYVEQVVTGQEALRSLMADPLQLSRDDALARIQGTLVGSDGKTTCAVVTLTPAGLKHRADVVQIIRDGLEKYCHTPRADQHFAGPVIDGLTVDEASNQSLNYFAVPSAITAFLICWWWLRWLPGALLVLAVSVYCEMATISLIHWFGGEMSALLIVLPPLIQVVTASGGIHLINYYLVARQTYEPENAAWGALRIGWVPCTLSATTNAIGLGSLVVSQLSPVRTFGLFGALGVVLTLGVVLAFVPGALAIWKPKGIARRATINLEDGSFLGEVPFWTWLSKFVARFHVAIVAGSIFLMIGLGWGIQWLKTSVHLRTLFPSDSRILDDYAWLEQHVAPLVPIEIVVGFDRQCPLSSADRFNLVGAIQDVLDRTEPIKGTVSVANMMPSLPADIDTGSSEYRDLLATILQQAQPHFAAAHYLSATPSRQQWRVTAYVSALEEIDYAQVLANIRKQLYAAGAADQPVAGISVRVTGVMPLVHEIQSALMHDLFLSFLSAFGIIAVIMSIAQAGILAGLIAMIPNFFPMVFMFGLLGWIGSALDIGSVMTASIALGIAIDDVLHFLTFFRRALARGLSRNDAVHVAYQQCGFAMFLSSLVCGLAPIAFYFSSFLPASRFAWMMLILLAIAVIGDLVLLPALVVSSLGKVFERQYTEQSRSLNRDNSNATSTIATAPRSERTAA
jgi:predicted RND superfamily exporter protein